MPSTRRRVRPLLVIVTCLAWAWPAAATQVAVVATGTPLPTDPRPDVRVLGEHELWIAPDGVEIVWPADAVVLRPGPGQELFLLRDHDHAPAIDDRGLHARAPLARVDGFTIVTAAVDDATLDEASHCRERLTFIGPAPRATLLPALARTADPLVKDSLVESVTYVRYTQIVRELSGDAPAPTSLGPRTILTRSTLTAGTGTGIDDAILYARETFEAHGYTVIEQTFPVSNRIARNLIAVREGTVSPNEVVVVGAHYDSRSEVPTIAAPGAEDNATGSAAVLHLAEIFAEYDTERTVHFVLFGGEEQGLFGSTYYVSQVGANGWSVVGALTMDMISAWQQDYAVVIEGQTAWKPLMDVMAANVTQYAQIPYTQTFFSFGSDHVPFQQAGIPAFLAIDDDWDLYVDYHRSTDTFEKVDPTLGWRISRAIAGSVVDLAGASPRVTTVDAPSTRPTLRLLANRPNPFNPRTEIRFELPVSGRTRLEILDLRGRHVTTLLDQPLSAGPSTVVWNGEDDEGRAVASGVYLYRLAHPAGERTRRLSLVR